MYLNEVKSTAVSYRLIHQNLPKFIDNMSVFSVLQKTSIIDFLLVDAVQKFYVSLQQNIFENENNPNVGKLLQELPRYNLDRIYLKNDTSLMMISKVLFDGNWALISNAVHFDYDGKSSVKSQKTSKYAESREKSISKVKDYTIGELNAIVEAFTGNL